MDHFRLYVKFPDQTRFAPIDYKRGCTVVNLIHASIFSADERAAVERDLALPENEGIRWEWRKVRGWGSATRADAEARAQVESELFAAGIIEDPDMDGGILG